MAHSKVHMLEDMRTRSKAIMDVLIKEGVTVKPDHLSVHEDADKLRADFIRPGYYWLREVHAYQFQEVLEVKKLLREEIWERYRNWGGFDEHREVVMLREALSELRKVVVARSRPDFFKKTAVAKKFKEIEKREKEK